MIVQFHPDTLKAMEDFGQTMKNPVTANIVWDNLRDSMKTVAMLEKNVSR